MPKFMIYGYVTASVLAEVEAKDVEEARRKAEDLSPPSVHTDHHVNLANGHWHYNEFDDPPDDAVQEVEQLDEDDSENGGGS